MTLDHCQTNFAGYIFARCETWLCGIRGSEHMSILFDRLIGSGRGKHKNKSTGDLDEHRYTKHLTAQFQKALLTYIELLDTDWKQVFGCCCSSSSPAGPAHIAYDNACGCDTYVSGRDPAFMKHFNILVDAFHGIGNSQHKGHESCSPGAGVGAWTAHSKLNHSHNERQNRRTKRLSLLSVGVGQVVFVALCKMQLKSANDVQRSTLQARIYLGILKQPQSPVKMYLCDGVNTAPLADKTFIHRKYLEVAVDQTTRFRNPNDLSSRVMIRDEAHKQALSSLLKLGPDYQDYQCIEWTTELSNLMTYVGAERTELLWLLKFEDDGGGDVEDAPELNSKVRLSSDVVELRELFLHWSARNHELCVVRPETAKSLQPFMYELNDDGAAMNDPQPYSAANYTAMIVNSPKPLRDFINYAEKQRRDCALQVLPAKAVAILTRMLQLSYAGLQSIETPVEPMPSLRENVHELLPCTVVGQPASGLVWHNLGPTKPGAGRDMESDTYEEGQYKPTEDEHIQLATSSTMGRLAQFLSVRHTLSVTQWESLGITGLRTGDFLRSGDSYYSPKCGMEFKFPNISHLADLDCEYLTAEFFPNHPLDPAQTARRFRMDELKDGRPSNARKRSADKVCNKKMFYGVRKFKAGLFTVYCLCCGMLLGFSVMDVAEGPRTLYDIFNSRSGWNPDGWQPDSNLTCYGDTICYEHDGADEDIDDEVLDDTHILSVFANDSPEDRVEEDSLESSPSGSPDASEDGVNGHEADDDDSTGAGDMEVGPDE